MQMAAKSSSVAANVSRVRERVAAAAGRAGRRPDEIQIVAVSKTFPSEAIRAAFDAGLRHFGENHVQEWEAKQSQLRTLDAVWHLVGHLQSNKARRATRLFTRVDSLDSLSLANKLNDAAASENKRLPVLIEVHLSSEATKSGVAESELNALAEAVHRLPHLELLGLMAIPPYLENPEHARPYFKKLRALRDGLNNLLHTSLSVLSMGMSHDFDIAIEEGATEIRIGTAIFGERVKR